MKSAIYAITYTEHGGEPTREQPKVFIQLRPAQQAFNREAKRLRSNDACWESVKLVKWEAVGTPRSVASAMVEIGSAISGGIPVRQINDCVLVSRAAIESEMIGMQQFVGVEIDA